MRILHLVRAETWGGGEQYVLDLAGICRRLGDCVSVVSRGVPEIDRRFEDIGINTFKLPLGGMLDFKSPRQLSRLILSLPDSRLVIHVHTFKDAEIAVRAKSLIGDRKKINLVCTRHLVKPGKKGWRWQWIYKGIDNLIFVSDLAKNVFLSDNPPIDESKLSVVHNSVIPPPSSHCVSLIDGDHKIRILFAGRISREKGIDILIKSLRFLNGFDVELRIAGTGPENLKQELRNLADDEGQTRRIKWLGFVEDVFAEIRKADICVFPSVWKEPFGLTIIEAMSQGKPVVTTNNGAQPEIITDGVDGFLVNPSDQHALAMGIQRLLKDSDLRTLIGRNAALTFNRRFSYRVFLNKIKDIYRNKFV